jgi:hypothetical protein
MPAGGGPFGDGQLGGGEIVGSTPLSGAAGPVPVLGVSQQNPLQAALLEQRQNGLMSAFRPHQPYQPSAWSAAPQLQPSGLVAALQQQNALLQKQNALLAASLQQLQQQQNAVPRPPANGK